MFKELESRVTMLVINEAYKQSNGINIVYLHTRTAKSERYSERFLKHFFCIRLLKLFEVRVTKFDVCRRWFAPLWYLP